MPSVAAAFAYATAVLVLVLLAAAVVYAGYLRYSARVLRERRPPPDRGPDPVHELARLNGEVRRRLADAHAVLEATREAVRKGTKG